MQHLISYNEKFMSNIPEKTKKRFALNLSFIIPALNEEKNICRVIDSINESLSPFKEINYEILVVDNGSNDRTPELCRLKSVKLLIKPKVRIGALRNAGARIASGDMFVFLDADVALTPQWGKNLSKLVSLYKKTDLVISGHRGFCDEKGSLFEKMWFTHHYSNDSNKYIPSGHLIVPRRLFNSLRGFNEQLVSGEDSDFCQKALAIGAKLKPLSELKVIHHGYPKNIKEFFFRERWHGYGDFQSFQYLKKSKPALVALFNISSLVTCLIIGCFVSRWAFLGYLAILLLLAFGSALHRNKFIVNFRVFFLMYVYVFYITARSLSLIDKLLHCEFKRWR